VELLVVLALLLILTVMSTSHFNSSARHRDLARCQTNLQKVYLALSIYHSDNGAFPFLKDAPNSAAALSLLIPKSTTVTEMFICPGSHDKALPEGESFARRRISYAYYMGRSTNNSAAEVILSDWQVNDLPKTQGRPLFSSDGKKPANNHGKDGGNLLLVNGEVIGCGTNAPRDLPVPPGITLLNPMP